MPQFHKVASISRYTLAVAFAWSAGGKLFWTGELRQLFAEIGVLPPPVIAPLSFALPVIEIMLAVALAIGFLLPVVGFLAMTLSMSFVAAHICLYAMGNVRPCGCAGVFVSIDGAESHVIMALICGAMAMCAALVLWSSVGRSVSRETRQPGCLV